jgi:hypothetical protein
MTRRPHHGLRVTLGVVVMAALWLAGLHVGGLDTGLMFLVPAFVLLLPLLLISTSLRALVTDRVAPGVVYTTFHHPMTQANVVTTEYADWATSCPEYKVTAVQVSPSNGPSEWQEEYEIQAMHSRRIAAAAEAAE